jgi:hypothetical protein
MKYKVRWQIALEAEVEADSKEDAVAEVESLDCQNDGSYIEDSFEIINAQPSKEE